MNELEEIKSMESEELEAVCGGAPTQGHMTAGMPVGGHYFLIIATATDYSVQDIYS